MKNKSIRLDYSHLLSELSEAQIFRWRSKAEQYHQALYAGTGAGSDFLGWLDLPNKIGEEDFVRIEETAAKLRATCDYVVSIGIGGSYLGAKAVIEALSNPYKRYEASGAECQILYAGHHISEDELFELQEFLSDKRFGIINISKSGTTTEPAIAFRVLRKLLETQRGADEARKRIVAITDSSRGALRTLADAEGYQSFVIPDNVGGRFSVLSPVGLLPIAVAGIDIRSLVEGAISMAHQTRLDLPMEENMALLYAAIRNELYANEKKIEILANYHPKLQYFCEWWKQLYGESEGKEHKGIFPASVNFTTDLHSMGQWIQDAERSIFETLLSVEESERQLLIPFDADNLDGLNFLAGKSVDAVNKMAELGTSLAHLDGAVPNMRICIPRLRPYYLGQLIYFFEKAVAISAYMLGVNPFDQPGVEAYKNNMFALLHKPGYDVESLAMDARLDKMKENNER